MTTVAHFINPFLPLTQNWIYNQLRFNTLCRNIVLCQTLENADQFPFENVFPVFPANSLAARFSMLGARLRARYACRPYLSVIHREKPDVLHGHFSWESWRNIRLIRKTNLPLLTTFYGLDVNKLSRRRVWKKRYAELFSRGDLFSVEGNYMAQALTRLGCPEGKIRVVPLGVDIEKIVRRRSPKTGEGIDIMFVGLEREKKGSWYAASAFSRIARDNPLCTLHVVGNGKFALPVKNVLRTAGVIGQCRFYGYLPYEAYCGLLGRMDILMAPSVTAEDGDTEGGAPVAVIEAHAAGIPVVATRHCDIPNIVVDGKTGLLCAERDVDGLTDNLNKLISDAALRKTMGEAARRHAAEHFSIERQVERLCSIYRSLQITSEAVSYSGRERPKGYTREER